MRPNKLEDFIGQEHLTNKNSYLNQMILSQKPRSIILWGPSGVGKTTLAHILAKSLKANFICQSAVNSGVKEIKACVEEAKVHQKLGNTATILFLDEIHRFNKSQQDSLLPYVENGLITLFGATTENPSVEVNPALLSRLQVLILKSLNHDNILTILKNALIDVQNGFGQRQIDVDASLLDEIARLAAGDARTALNILEASAELALSENCQTVGAEHLKNALSQGQVLRLGKASDLHYNMTSALIKSVRNSNVNASLYWLARLLEAGENPLFIARRMLCLASEDVGLAAPSALNQAVSAYQAVSYLGMPEAKLPLSQIVIYLSLAPKSNTVLTSYEMAKKVAIDTADLEVPLTLRNPTNNFHKSLGYGQDYLYVHDVGQENSQSMHCFPDELDNLVFFKPGKNGFESKF